MGPKLPAQEIHILTRSSRIWRKAAAAAVSDLAVVSVTRSQLGCPGVPAFVARHSQSPITTMKTASERARAN